MKGYDKVAVNHEMLMDLPFLEGTGALTRDVAKPHHQPITLVNTPTWTNLVSGLPVLELDGTNEFLELTNAACLDLDFMAGDYSVSAWINWVHNPGGNDQNVIGRYEVDVSGWELYLYDSPNYYLTLRHHHAGTCTPGPPIACRTACYSGGWTQGTWHFIGISRSGATQTHFRNGVALATTCGALVDPEICAQDLVIGARFDKGSNYYKGQLDDPRIWGRSLSAQEWAFKFETERHWYGV